MHTAECPHCDSRDTVKNGFYRYKDRPQRQRYLCRGCGQSFNEDTGSPYHGLHYDDQPVTLAVMLQTQMALSGSQTVIVLATTYDVRPNRRTVQRWVRRFAPHLVQLQRRLGPQFSDRWMTDELFCNRHAHHSKRTPDPKYLYTVLDSLRQVVATLTSDRRDAASIVDVLTLAVEEAGQAPTVLSHDGWNAYTTATRRLRPVLGKTRCVEAHFDTKVVPVTREDGDGTTRRGVVRVSQNLIERYHCYPRARENSMRGVKSAESGTHYFQAMAVAYNLFKPHAFHGGVPPAVAVGWSPGLEWRDLPDVL